VAGLPAISRFFELMAGIYGALLTPDTNGMNWIYYRGEWYRVTVVTKDKEYRLTRPGHRTHITLTRQGLERAMRDYFRMAFLPVNQYED